MSMVAKLSREAIARPLRFGLVGAINTAVGLAVIMVCIAAGMADVEANATGYAVGLTMSFFLNRRWTFGHSDRIDGSLVIRYAASFLIAYIANLTVALALIGAETVARPVAHVIGAGVYTALFYVLCRSYVFAGGSAQGETKESSSSFSLDGFAIIIVIAVGLLYWALKDIQLGHDQSWYLIAVSKILAGARPYIDIVELNPPLAFYVYMPPVYLAERLGASPSHLFVLYILFLAAVSSLWARSLLRNIAGMSTVYADVAALLTLVLVSAFSAFDYGQRDVLLMTFTLPYLALSLSRLEGAHVTRESAIAVGLWAAIGICLKPYFLVFPIAAEIVFFLYRRRFRKILTPEVIAIGVFGIGYIAATALFLPAYFETIVPMARATYFAYGVHFPYSLPRPAIVFAAITLAIYPFLRTKTAATRRLDMLAAWTVAALTSYVLQNKGFSYHAVPMRIMLVLLTADLIFRDFNIHLIGRLLAKTVLGVVLALLVAQSYVNGAYNNTFVGPLRERIARYPVSDGIYTFTAHLFIGFPLVNHLGVPWDSRFPALWPIPGAVRILTAPENFSPERVAEAKDINRYVTQAVIDDFERRLPSIVIVDARDDKFYFDGVKFDFLANFERNPDFARLWRNYALADTYKGFQIWHKVQLKPAVTAP